jgi:septum formation protein
VITPLSDSSPLVLGSGSPRRREILGALRVPFVVVPGDADESVHPGERVGAYLDRVVRAKLASVRARLREAASAAAAGKSPAILVADTSVTIDDAILGKPETEADGLAMIERLAGRTHEVHTRFAIGRTTDGEPLHAETTVTRVTFRGLAHGEGRAYVASGEGRDKAGGYAVQGLAMAFVARIEGSYTNVVGLPACEVLVALRALGLSVAP